MCQLLYHDGVYTTEVSVVLEIFQAHVIMTFLKTLLKKRMSEVLLKCGNLAGYHAFSPLHVCS